MKIAALLLALTAGACAAAENMTVHVVSDDPNLVAAGELAVQAWAPLGFSLSDYGQTLTIVSVVDLRSHDQYANKLNGHTVYETATVEVDAVLIDTPLQHVVTHEFGHALTHCDHLNPSEHGVMAWGLNRVGWPTEPTADDFALMCRSSGLCVTP